MKKKWLKGLQKRNKPAEDQRLSLLAKELGVAMMMVLVNDYDFSQEEADLALGKVLTQAQTTRKMMVVNVVTAAYDVQSKKNDP